MNPAEIVKKVLGGHGPNLHDCACACGLPVQRIEHPNLPLPLFFDFDAHRAHVASEIVVALGLAQIAPTYGQERPKPANVGTGEGTGLEGAQIGAQEVYARGGPLSGPTTIAVSHVGYCARGHDLYAIDGVTQHIITHAETKSGNWAKATCPNVIVERSEETE